MQQRGFTLRQQSASTPAIEMAPLGTHLVEVIQSHLVLLVRTCQKKRDHRYLFLLVVGRDGKQHLISCCLHCGDHKEREWSAVGRTYIKKKHTQNYPHPLQLKRRPCRYFDFPLTMHSTFSKWNIVSLETIMFWWKEKKRTLNHFVPDLSVLRIHGEIQLVQQAIWVFICRLRGEEGHN